MATEIKTTPEERIFIGNYEVIVNHKDPWAIVINSALEKAGRSERFRTISEIGHKKMNNEPKGVWDLDEARKIIDGIGLDNDPINYYYGANMSDYQEDGDGKNEYIYFNVKKIVHETLIENGILLGIEPTAIQKIMGSTEERFRVLIPDNADRETPVVKWNVKDSGNNPDLKKINLVIS